MDQRCVDVASLRSGAIGRWHPSDLVRSTERFHGPEVWHCARCYQRSGSVLRSIDIPLPICRVPVGDRGRFVDSIERRACCERSP